MKEYNLNITDFCKVVGISRTSFYSYMEGRPTWVFIVQNMSKNASQHKDKEGLPLYIFHAEKIY